MRIANGIFLGSGSYGGFSPLSLSPTVMFDTSDPATRYQTGSRASPGSPATIATDPLGLLLDKSGNNNDATQATGASRPLLFVDSGGRICGRGDGVVSGMGFAVPLSVINDCTIVLGVTSRHAPSNPNAAMVLESSTGSLYLIGYDNDNAFGVGGARLYTGVSAVNENVNRINFANVVTMRSVSGSQILRTNGAQVGTNTLAPAYTGTSLGGALFRGVTLTQFSQCDIYSVLIFAGALSASNLALCETWAGAKMGIVV